jgi:hypothetical protein
MFIAYFDESWDEKQRGILVIAGMIGLWEQWDKIEWRWRELLDKYQIAYYRATEAESANGQFDKPPYRTPGVPLTAAQFKLLREVKDEFFKVLTFGRISGAAIGVPIQLFNQVADTPQKQTQFGNTPYYICGHTAMLVLLEELKRVHRFKDLVVFRFDRQKDFESEMKRVHANLLSSRCEFHSQVGSICFENKKNYLLLQVADTLAYECRKYLERLITDPNAVPRPELKRLMDEGKIFKIALCEKTFLEAYLINNAPTTI